ncbi:MAG: phage minor capsid protein, partial [Umezawaea sp.]
MPVPPEQLDDIAATVAAIYREAETALVRIIAGHLAGDMDSDMQAPAWADKKLAAVQALRRSAQAVIAGLQADSSTAIRDAAAQAYRAGWTSALAELPKEWFPKSALAKEATSASAELPGFAAVEAMAAAVHTDIGIPARNILRNVLDAYRAVITAATARTVTGVQTRREASQAAWKRFMDRGISGFVDRAGRRWQLSSYVEMAVRTVTQRAAVTGQTDRLDALGIDLVMVSNNVQECALCRPYEGRVLRRGAGPTGTITVPHQLTDKPFTVDVVATLPNAMVDGLFHPNCPHSISAYLPGVSKLPEQPTADPEGNKARQQQRALERKIRAAKVNEQGALDEPSRKAAGRRVRAAQAELRDHLEQHPKLKRLPYREQIGAGNIPPKGKKDPAGGIGPEVQPTLDGGPGSAAAKPGPDNDPDNEVPATDPDQLSFDDLATDTSVPAKAPEPDPVP